MGNEKVLKFVRALPASIPQPGAPNQMTQCTAYHMKLLYEFWGFCVNGDNSLTAPGGFASGVGTNYLSMSAGFESGSSVLLASGSDGNTTYGNQVFSASSVNWTSGSVVGKWLVTWKSGSSSTDDSIYTILQVLNSSSILVDTRNGGTPATGSLKPAFIDRTNVNFRVVDVLAAAQLPGYVTNMYMVLQFNGASAVNAGQANSQLKMRVQSGSTAGQDRCDFTLSPSGTWNGSTFTDASPELPPDCYNAGVTAWFTGTGGNTNMTGFITLIADQACLIMYSAGDWATNQGSTGLHFSSWFHVEVPNRLYPASKDPNPVAMTNNGKNGIILTSFQDSGSDKQQGFAAGWHVPNPFDNGTLRRWNALTRSITTDGWNQLIYQNAGGDGVYINVERIKQMLYNKTQKRSLIFDVILGQRTTTTSFSLGRVQLRRAMVAPGPPQSNIKYGANGEWIHTADGLLWPWDNTILPYRIFYL